VNQDSVAPYNHLKVKEEINDILPVICGEEMNLIVSNNGQIGITARSVVVTPTFSLVSCKVE
jgi:hypothetical protein